MMGGKATMIPVQQLGSYTFPDKNFDVLTEYRARLQMLCPDTVHIANVITYHGDDLELKWEIIAVDKRISKIYHLHFKSDELPVDEIEAKINLIGA